MEKTTKTIYSSYLQACLFSRKPFVMKPKTTLNEKLDINKGIAPAAGEYPSFGYFAIGNGGHSLTVSDNNIPVTTPVQHASTDGAPFSMLPFVLRETNNDLNASQRALYALRKLETIDGRNYFAYYLRRIDLSASIPEMYLTTVTDGVSETHPFIPTDSNLNPTPKPLTNTGVNVVSGDMTQAYSSVNVVFTPADVDELLNVAKIKYNDERLAVISEVALCTGLDKVMTSPSTGNTTIQVNEAICVQVAAHVNAMFNCQFLNNGFEMPMEIGSLEPLFNLVG